MMPDAQAEFLEIIHTEFPVASFITALGFLLILLVEKVLIGKSKQLSSEKQEDKKIYRLISCFLYYPYTPS